MAQIYVGFNDQRNSSRVLKPPGGGTSDIFGTEEERGVIATMGVPQASGVETGQYRGSSIQEVLRSEAIITTVVEDSIAKKTTEKVSDSTIGNILSQEEIQEKDKVKRLNSPRVPPGGYSSGLW